MRGRRYEPLDAGHPALDQDCVACRKRFAQGDVTTLILLGPGDDPEEQERARQGRPYVAKAALVHWSCAGGRID